MSWSVWCEKDKSDEQAVKVDALGNDDDRVFRVVLSRLVCVAGKHPPLRVNTMPSWQKREKSMYREQLLAAYQKRYGCLPANVDVFWTYLQTFHSDLHLSQTIYQELAAWFALKGCTVNAMNAPIFRSPVGEELERDTKY